MRLGTIVRLVTPTGLEFLISIGFLGCCHPVYIKIWRMGAIYLVMVNNPASLASAPEDMTYLIICAMVRIGPLYHGTGSFYVSIM